MKKFSLVASLSAFLAAVAAQAGPGSYYVIDQIQVADLGTLGGDEAVAHDINNLGQVVGWALDNNGMKRAFIWRGNGTEYLYHAWPTESAAYGINNSTRVVGEYWWPNSNGTHGFYWEDGWPFFTLWEAVSPEDAPYCATGGSAKAINDYGVIVGVRRVGCNPPNPFIKKAARWQSYLSPWEDLLLNIHSAADYYAYDINNAGVIAGHERHGYYSSTGAWLWKAGAVPDVPHPAVSPPELAYPSTQRALGINDAGQVVGDVNIKPQGSGTDETVKRAFYWNGTSASSTKLPIFSTGKNSTAYEINMPGFIVGSADRQNAFSLLQRRAVIWHKDIGITQLPLPSNTSAGSLLSPTVCEAYAVNDRKSSGLMQAVGYCRAGGKYRALRWNVWTSLVTPPSITSR